MKTLPARLPGGVCTKRRVCLDVFSASTRHLSSFNNLHLSSSFSPHSSFVFCLHLSSSLRFPQRVAAFVPVSVERSFLIADMTFRASHIEHPIKFANYAVSLNFGARCPADREYLFAGTARTIYFVKHPIDYAVAAVGCSFCSRVPVARLFFIACIACTPPIRDIGHLIEFAAALGCRICIGLRLRSQDCKSKAVSSCRRLTCDFWCQPSHPSHLPQ